MESLRYIINAELCELARNLFLAGFGGEIKMSHTGCTGTEAHFEGPFMAMEISGFCKETLYIAWDMEQERYLMVGRYEIRGELEANDPPTVDSLAQMAWSTYKHYKVVKNWGRPMEWDPIWKARGYITTKTVQKTVEEEMD